MTPRDRLQRLLIEHRTAHDPASSEREILRMFDQYVPNETPPTYGCHCDLEPGMKPDKCVLDDDRPYDCIHAAGLSALGKGKESCKEWRPIEVVRRKEQQT